MTDIKTKQTMSCCVNVYLCVYMLWNINEMQAMKYGSVILTSAAQIFAFFSFSRNFVEINLIKKIRQNGIIAAMCLVWLGLCGSPWFQCGSTPNDTICLSFANSELWNLSDRFSSVRCIHVYFYMHLGKISVRHWEDFYEFFFSQRNGKSALAQHFPAPISP